MATATPAHTIQDLTNYDMFSGEGAIWKNFEGLSVLI